MKNNKIGKHTLFLCKEKKNGISEIEWIWSNNVLDIYLYLQKDIKTVMNESVKSSEIFDALSISGTENGAIQVNIFNLIKRLNDFYNSKNIDYCYNIYKGAKKALKQVKFHDGYIYINYEKTFKEDCRGGNKL